MDENKKYFIYLLSCQINQKKIIIENKQIDWNKIYKLAKIHDLIVIIFSAINTLPIEYRPNAEIYNKFKTTRHKFCKFKNYWN